MTEEVTALSIASDFESPTPFVPTDSKVTYEYMVLMPDGEWLGSAGHSLRDVTNVYEAVWEGKPVVIFKDLSYVIDAVSALMRRAAEIGATDYRPVVYERRRVLAYLDPEPSESAERILGPVVVTIE